jgi:GNAT superfamily N-acetyltransferase
MTVTIHPLVEQDLPAAARIIRVAFGTFIGHPEPGQLWADIDYAHTRWRADPTAAFKAEMDGELVGSNFASRWGSVGFFGPLRVRPDLWDRGIGKRLMEPIVTLFDQWGVTHAGLFTFAHSPKHLGLYQRFGFWPRALTAIMSKPVPPGEHSAQYTRYSEVPDREREACLCACQGVTETIYPGLEVEREIQAVHTQGLGYTVLLWEEGALIGFGVCHGGPGTEAGTDTCYVKFGAVQQGPLSAQYFERLLDACEGLAAAQGLTCLEVGMNMARHEAYRLLPERGFRTDFQGVAMHRDNEPGYNQPGVYLIDDWR